MKMEIKIVNVVHNVIIFACLDGWQADVAEHVAAAPVQEDAGGGHQEDREEVLPLGASVWSR